MDTTESTEHEPVDFLSPYGRDMDFRQAEPVSCPACGFGWNHIVRVVVNRGGTVDVLEHRSAPARRFSSFPTGRGSSVWIEFFGECGHAWALRFQFHKGEVYTAFEWSDEVHARDGELLWPCTFWRD